MYLSLITLITLLNGRREEVSERLQSARTQDADWRERGSLTLEQAIITAVVSAAAIALGVIVVGAVTNHQSNIK